VHLAPFRGQRGAVERHDTAVALVDVAHLEEGHVGSGVEE
jgi:hypothetical protein